MGHDSPAAALIYQHATSEADRAIAAALGDALATITDQGGDHGDGTAGRPARAS
jgi:hypothetical protein